LRPGVWGARAQVANIALNNMSLVFLSLSLSQIIRSGIPVLTALLGVLIERKVPTSFELLSLVVLTAGVVLSVRPLAAALHPCTREPLRFLFLPPSRRCAAEPGRARRRGRARRSAARPVLLRAGRVVRDLGA
jgi:hypothetical protein